ncbi:glycosyltransferase family 4 protein [Luteirhabdus pelagi]|uniref:glycosyltransferase family 4 protein n=1 Tax=Luteirhabdus pelagi TaxID=2792783 RepID=UPI00193993DA|nr:glycosyltransferase family 4 protein [Luteirhabdus pelagi]
MKVLHISYATTWGGGEQQMIDLVHALNDLGIVNPLLCCKGSELASYAEKKGLLYFPIDKKSLKIISGIIKKEAPELLHIHTGSSIKDFILFYFIHGIRIPTVYTINGIMRKKSFFSRLKYNFKGIKAIHFVSQAAQQHFEEEIAFRSSYDKLYTIYDGIREEMIVSEESLKSKLDLPSEAFLVGNIANHTRAKNLSSLVKVAELMVKRNGNSNIHFIQLGRKTKSTPELEAEVIEKNLEKNIHFLGFTENAETYLPQFDCLLMTSNREGLPLTIMEAFKYKVPVVTTNAGGIPEAIQHGETGLMTEIDNNEELARYVESLYNDSKISERLVANAHSFFEEQFTAQRMGTETLKLYQKVLDET